MQKTAPKVNVPRVHPSADIGQRTSRASIIYNVDSSASSDEVIVPSYGDSFWIRLVRVILVVTNSAVLGFILGHFISTLILDRYQPLHPFKWWQLICLTIVSVSGLYGASYRKQNILIYFVMLCLVNAASLLFLGWAEIDDTKFVPLTRICWILVGHLIISAFFGCVLAANDSKRNDNRKRVQIETYRVESNEPYGQSQPPHYSSIVPNYNNANLSTIKEEGASTSMIGKLAEKPPVPAPRSNVNSNGVKN